MGVFSLITLTLLLSHRERGKVKRKHFNFDRLDVFNELPREHGYFFKCLSKLLGDDSSVFDDGLSIELESGSP